MSTQKHMRNRREISFSEPLDSYSYQSQLFQQSNTPAHSHLNNQHQTPNKHTPSLYPYSNPNKYNQSPLQKIHQKCLPHNTTKNLSKQSLSSKQQEPSYQRSINKLEKVSNHDRSIQKDMKQKYSKEKVDRISSINMINDKIKSILLNINEENSRKKMASSNVKNEENHFQNIYIQSKEKEKYHYNCEDNEGKHFINNQKQSTMLGKIQTLDIQYKTPLKSKNLNEFNNNHHNTPSNKHLNPQLFHQEKPKPQKNHKERSLQQERFLHSSQKQNYHQRDTKKEQSQYSNKNKPSWNNNSNQKTCGREDRQEQRNKIRKEMFQYSENRAKWSRHNSKNNEPRSLSKNSNKVIINGRDIDDQITKISYKMKSLYEIKKSLLVESFEVPNSYCNQQERCNNLNNKDITFQKECTKLSSVEQSMILRDSIAESTFKIDDFSFHHKNQRITHNNNPNINFTKQQQLGNSNPTENTSQHLISNISNKSSQLSHSQMRTNSNTSSMMKVSQEDVRLPKLLKNKRKKNYQMAHNQSIVENITDRTNSNTFQKPLFPQQLRYQTQNLMHNLESDQNMPKNEESLRLQSLRLSDYFNNNKEQIRQEYGCKGFKELMINFDEQIKLDEHFRKLKKWFNRIKNDIKWYKLQNILKNNSIIITQSQMKIIFSTSYEEQNPFYTPREDDYKTQDLFLAFKEAEEHWNTHIVHQYNCKKLKQAKFTEQNMDISKRGFLSIEDIVRYVNYELNKFYRNRDLYLIYLRLKQNTQLYYTDMMEILTQQAYS